VLLTYTRLARPRSRAGLFGDAGRARWLAGDVRFATELSRRIFVSAQPGWAALVVETAWPEPRPEPVAALLTSAEKASTDDLAELRDRIGADTSRSELARLACEVIAEARKRESGEVGGDAAGRFVLAAAKVASDDEAAVRIFAALVLPAAFHRG
jgi:hypothetical protein